MLLLHHMQLPLTPRADATSAARKNVNLPNEPGNSHKTKDPHESTRPTEPGNRPSGTPPGPAPPHQPPNPGIIVPLHGHSEAGTESIDAHFVTLPSPRPSNIHL